MHCKACNRQMDEATAAADFDAGVPTWNLCDECASALLTGQPVTDIDKPVTGNEDAG